MSPEGEAKGLIRTFGRLRSLKEKMRSFALLRMTPYPVALRPFLFCHPEAERPKGLRGP